VVPVSWANPEPARARAMINRGKRAFFLMV